MDEKQGEFTLEKQAALRIDLSLLLEKLLKKYGDTHEVRLQIVSYTMGYMGASYGLKID